MANSAKQRSVPKDRARSRQSNPSLEFVWMGLVGGLGLGGVVAILVGGYAFGLWGTAANARPECAVSSKQTDAAPSAATLSNRAPTAGLPEPPMVRPSDGEANTAVDVQPPSTAQIEPQPTMIPSPEPLPVVSSKSAGQSKKILSESELRRQLRDVPEFGLKPSVRDALVESYKKIYQSSAAMGRKPIHDPATLLAHMPGVQQLSVRSFPSCQLNPISAMTLGVSSRALHAYVDGLAPKDASGKRADPKQLRAALRQEWRGKRPAWLRPEALPAMVQILMAEEVPLRLILVDMMADIPGRAAGIRLAQRAVYDLSPEVRKAAIDALRQRPAIEARRILVETMRYPWPAVADHAAAALAALQDRGAAPLLVALLEKPDPAAPVATKAGTSVCELVRINHAENCLLCHVPAVGRDPVTDVDPFARRPSQTYEVRYGGARVPGGSGGVWANKVLIRADVQLLRQDFSITFPANSEFSSAGGRRFDFLVRTRPLSATEVQNWSSPSMSERPTYPQRDAVLAALRAIAGQDAGPTTEAWLKLYPHAHAEAEGARMAAALRAAHADQREQLMARYRDAKEEHYTEGLAHAIANVSGKLQEKVRMALVERLARLSADELRAHLESEGEMRLAAARACIRKADAEMISDLIELLAEGNAEIAAGAHKALRQLTGENLGTPVEGTQDEREAAVAKWREWYEQRGL